MSTSRLAQLAFVIALAALALYVGGPLLALLGALDGFLAFRLFLLGAALGALTLLLGLLGVFATRPARGRAGRRRALTASAVGLAIVGCTFALAGPSAQLPVINDVTTDPADPPGFRALAQDPANQGRDMSYPAANAALQAAAYPELAPIELELSAARTHTLLILSMRDLGWEVARSDPESGEIEATETSRVFGFVDDVAVRLRPTAQGTRVDVRSKSRDGRGDLGANAARIERLREML